MVGEVRFVVGIVWYYVCVCENDKIWGKKFFFCLHCNFVLGGPMGGRHDIRAKIGDIKFFEKIFKIFTKSFFQITLNFKAWNTWCTRF